MDAISEATGANRSETGDNRLRVMPPQEHARLLLAWAQGPGGLAGEWALHCVLIELYHSMCLETNLQPYGWTSIGRHLRVNLGQRKEMTPPIRGRRKRIYFIPHVAPELPALDGQIDCAYLRGTRARILQEKVD